MTNEAILFIHNALNDPMYYVNLNECSKLSVEDRSEVYAFLEENGSYLIPLSELKGKVIAYMSEMCNKTIIDGVDVVLSDGESHHFSLDITDQMNLSTLQTLIASGETQIPYHETGMPCKFYTPQDILLLCEASTAHVEYHTTYFNSLRDYINSLENGVDVYCVDYGMEIPVEYQSEVFKALLSNA